MDEGIKGILWVLVGVGLIWLFLGGPGRMADRMGIFIKPPSPIDTGETYGKVSFWKSFKQKEEVPPQNLSEEERIAWELEQAKKEVEKTKIALEKLKGDQNTSPFKGKVEIRRCRGSQTDVDEEYLELSVNLPVGEKVLISDWSLKSEMTGIKIKVGAASKLPYTSQINKEFPIFVSGGDKIIILTGRSPIGVSFQINKCSGYLEQFQDFNPSINKKCPLVKNEDLPVFGPNAFNDECWDYIDHISRCETPLTFPIGMQHECRSYLTTEVNYNNCVNNYKNEDDFYQPEWRIFLERINELWKKEREIIQLLDAQDKVVDVYTY